MVGGDARAPRREGATAVKRQVAKNFGVPLRVASYIISHRAANMVDEAIAEGTYEGTETGDDYRDQAALIVSHWSDDDWLAAMSYFSG